MAIAGTGGWVPSCRVVLKQIGPVATGIVTNKPPELIYSDLEKRAAGTLAEGLVHMRRGEAVQIDMTNGQFMRLLELWKEENDANAAQVETAFLSWLNSWEEENDATSGRGRDERVPAGTVAPGAAADVGDGAALADGGGFAAAVD